MATQPNIYSESAIWLCQNRKTGYRTRIGGPLAEILKKYPEDYRLRLLKIKEVADGHAIATDQ